MPAIACHHVLEKGRYYHAPYFGRVLPWEKQPEPTREEIREHRLWLCPDCKQWSSLLGHVKKELRRLVE